MLASSDPLLCKDWVDFKLWDPSLYKEECPLSQTAKDLKTKALVLASKCRDRDTLQELSRSLEGLLNIMVRHFVWTFLLDIPLPMRDTFLYQLNVNDLPEHRDEDQVVLDTRRLFTGGVELQKFPLAGCSFSFVYSFADIEEMRRRLFSLIVGVLRKYPGLHYYQGYHDIASIILILSHTNPPDKDLEVWALEFLEWITVFHLRDFMLPNIDLTVNHLKIIAALLEETDPLLFQLTSVSSQSYQCTNGQYYDYKFIEPLLLILTLFSHNISNLTYLYQIWDFIFSYKSVSASLYIYTAALHHFKKDIMTNLSLEEGDLDAMYNIDPAEAHNALSASNLFANLTQKDVLQILSKARLLIEQHPLLDLSNRERTFDLWFGRFNKHSVLMTSSSLNDSKQAPQLLEPPEFDKLLQLQHQEQQAETAHSSELLVHHIEQSTMTDSFTSAEDEVISSQTNLLSSSLSSLSAASNSLNNTLVNKSSLFFKKIFSRSDDNVSGDDSTVAKRKKQRGILRHNIYKISVSVGFVGFLVHCLLRHSEVSIRNYPLGPLGLLNSIGSSVESLIPETLSTVRHGFREVAGGITSKFGEALNAGIDVTQLGIGTVRDSIYVLRR